MKTAKQIVLSVLVGGWFISCSASNQPNATVEKEFEKRFGKVADVSWTSNADYSFAHFKQNGKAVVVVFGNDGQLIATEPAKATN